MRRIFAAAALLLAAMSSLGAQEPRLVRVSDRHVCHLVFESDITYVQVSDDEMVWAEIVEQRKDMLRLLADKPFEGRTSITVTDKARNIYVFYLEYCAEPDRMIVSVEAPGGGEKVLPSSEAAQPVPAASSVREASGVPAGEPVSLSGGGVLPLGEVLGYPRKIYHVYSRVFDIEAMCTNLFVDGDYIYMVFAVRNGSAISFSSGAFAFQMIGKKRGGRNPLDYDDTFIPLETAGELLTAPGSETRTAYRFSKFSLRRGEVLKVYVSERDGGNRNLELTFTPKDINDAIGNSR